MVGALTPFGTLSDGRAVDLVTLSHGALAASILTYGARLQSFHMGDGPSLCVGSDRLARYEGPLAFAGPVVAPVINRIGGASARIDGTEYRFEANQDGRHTLHSGAAGAQFAIWDVARSDTASVTLTHRMPAGQGGFPGNRTISVTYALTEAALCVTLEAMTDAPTLMNPALHGVWNLDGTADWGGHRLSIPAETHLPAGPDTRPTGKIAPVAGTGFDYRAARAPDPALDHNFCFDAPGLRATLTGTSGRTLTIRSDAPGLQAYTGGREGIALEPQLWPDAPNNPHFPPILLRPGETFRQSTDYIPG